jgi:RNA polymerase sigma factor (sigma-70 family)
MDRYDPEKLRDSSGLRFADGERSDPFFNYLYRSAKRECAQRSKQLRAFVELTELLPGGWDQIKTDQGMLVDDLIQQLKPKERRIFELLLEGNRHREIGELLGMKEGAVATTISRVRSRMRGLLIHVYED